MSISMEPLSLRLRTLTDSGTSECAGILTNPDF